ncbi:MAG: T9SS type A sorting domain-containing protein [Bacteroidales bacterium]|nr:T9SS type A sorting domain-containing protein [Bacteroidales bacterium]
MKKHKLIALVAIFSIFLSTKLCATTINVASGTDNGLENLIVSGSTNSGDTIILTDVGPYNCSSPKIVMTKSLTIKAAAGLSARPIVKVTATTTQSNFMGFTTSGTYYFNWEGIEFDGNNYTTTFMQVYQPCKVKVKNCVFKNIRSTPTSTASATFLTYATTINNDSLIVENSQFVNIYKGILSITSSGAAHPSSATFRNCNFAGAFNSYALNLTAPVPVVLDHCTFNACSFPELKIAGTATISNCIFSNNTNADNSTSLKMSLTNGNLTNHCAVYNPNHLDIYQSIDTTSALIIEPSYNSYSYATNTTYVAGGSDGKVIGFSPSLVIDVTPSTSSILRGSTQQYSATVTDKLSAFSPTVLWSTTTGSINSSGLYSGTIAGNSLPVTASVYGYSGAANINVDTLRITVTPSFSSIWKNGVQQFSAVAVDQNGQSYSTPFTWSASAGSIDSNGLFSGTTTGTNIVVTASAEGFSGTANINVQALTIAVTPANSSMNRGSSQQFSASAVDQNGNPYSTSFTWSASGGSITSGGLFTCPSANGNVVITATSNGFSGTTNFKVNGLTTSLNAGSSVSAAVTSLADGDTIILAQTGIYTWAGKLTISTAKSVSIRAANGLASRPIIRESSAASSFIYYSAGTAPKTFSFNGVEFDGNNLAYGLILGKCAANGNLKVVMKNCLVRNLYQSAGSLNAIAFTYGSVTGGPATYDDLTVEDTEFRNVQSAIIGTSALNTSPNNVSFKNCLFVGPFTKAAVGIAAINSVKMEHCTFESCNLKELTLKTNVVGTVLRNVVFAHNSGTDANSMGDAVLNSSCGVYYTGTGDMNLIYPTLSTSNALVNDPVLNSYKYATDSAYLARSTDGRGLGYSPKLKIVASPATFTMNKYGKKQFTFTVSDSLTAFVPTLKYSSSLGSITSSALYTGSIAGRSISVTGSAYGQSKSASVDVMGTNVFITPNPALVYIGYNKQFSSTAADQDGNSYSGTQSWVATGSLGSINSSGLFVPSTIGTGSLIATIGAYTDTIALAVEPPSTIVPLTMGSYKFSWKFDKVLDYGYFVDGQPWIVLPAGGANLVSVSPSRIVGATVKTVAVAPAVIGANVTADIHQTVINPPIGTYYQNNTGAIKTRNAFGWDSRGAIRYGLGNNYNAALVWNGSPKALAAGDVITTAWSLTTETPNNTCLNAVAVLTVLDTIPPTDAFRPGIIRCSSRRAHPYYFRKSQVVDLSSKLISKPTTSLLGVTLPTDAPAAFQASKLTKLYPGPSIMIAGLSNNRSFNALYNNSGNGYGREVAMDLGDLAVGSLASWLTPAQRDTCQTHFLQRAIDTYETVLDSAVLAFNGGHMPGYGALITIAGKMLNNSGMLSINQSINGRDPYFFLSDYGQMLYIDDSSTNYGDGIRPDYGNARRITTSSTLPGLNLKTMPILSASSGSIAVDTAFHWPIYRAAREVQNLKFKIESGPGAGNVYYVMKGISNYYNIITGNDTLSNNPADNWIKGGTVTVKPVWVNGTPTSSSVIKLYPTVSTEAPCWAFHSGGINSSTGTLDYDYSLSPYTDYGSINAGSSLSYLCALYKLDGDSVYSSGIDRWMIGTMQNPGYGDAMFRDGNARQLTEPNPTATPESPFLSGLWKNLVLDKVGVTFVPGNGTTDSLLIPPYTRSAMLAAEPDGALDLISYAGMNSITVKSKSLITRVELISMQGATVVSKSVNNTDAIVPVNRSMRGSYVLRVVTDEQIYTKKIVVR